MRNQVGAVDSTSVEPFDDGIAAVPFGDVLAEALRPPYVWWLVFAVVLQAYSPLYVTVVAMQIVVMTLLCARRAVSDRTGSRASAPTR